MDCMYYVGEEEMSRYTQYGPGDEITWPPYSGNPNDPRHEDDFDEDEIERSDYEPDYYDTLDDGWGPVELYDVRSKW